MKRLTINTYTLAVISLMVLKQGHTANLQKACLNMPRESGEFTEAADTCGSNVLGRTTRTEVWVTLQAEAVVCRGNQGSETGESEVKEGQKMLSVGYRQAGSKYEFPYKSRSREWTFFCGPVSPGCVYSSGTIVPWEVMRFHNQICWVHSASYNPFFWDSQHILTDQVAKGEKHI